MDKEKPKFDLKTVNHEEKKLGYKATIAVSLENQEIYKHEVKLWNEDSRKVFAKGCISKLNGNLTAKQKEDALARTPEANQNWPSYSRSEVGD